MSTLIENKKIKIKKIMVSETKLDSSFRQAQFRMEGYAPPLDMIETLMVVENGRKI